MKMMNMTQQKKKKKIFFLSLRMFNKNSTLLEFSSYQRPDFQMHFILNLIEQSRDVQDLLLIPVFAGESKHPFLPWG